MSSILHVVAHTSLLPSEHAYAFPTIQPSEAAQHVVALLVISCPCALDMATPLAMAVASGRAARIGIFIKSDQATQQLAAIDTIVLDKMWLSRCRFRLRMPLAA